MVLRFLERTNELSKHTLLPVAGERDEGVTIGDNHRPLMQALESAGADVSEVVLDADHEFSARRIALAHTLVSWLEQRCR